MFGISLPANTIVHGFTADVHLLGPLQLSYKRALNYAIESWILPVMDPDSGVQYDTIWDTMVPKDSDVDTLDLDTVAAPSTESFYEPGEIDWSNVFDVGVEGTRLTARTSMVSAASRYSMVIQDPADADGLRWTAMEQTNVSWGGGNGGIKIEDPSVLVCAFGNPAADDITANKDEILAENEWARVQYIEDMLKQAYYQLTGITGAVNVSPWQDSTDLMQKYIDPDVYSDTSGFWVGAVWDVLSSARIDISLEGDLKIGVLSGGR